MKPRLLPFSWEPDTISQSTMLAAIGVYSYSNPSGLKHGTRLVFDQHATSREGFDIESWQSLVSVEFPILTDLTEGGYLWLSDHPKLTSIKTPLLVTIGGWLQIQNCALLASVSFPALTTLSHYAIVRDNAALTTISVPVLASVVGNVDFSGNALSAGTVNALLAMLVAANGGTWAQTAHLEGGTNAAPSGQGVTDKATLIGRGASIATN